MKISEIVKGEDFFKRGRFPHAILFQSVDKRLNEVALIMTALAINYKTFELFDEDSAEYLKVKKGADIDIKIYPKNNEKLLVSDSNEIVSEVYIKPAFHENKVFIIENPFRVICTPFFTASASEYSDAFSRLSNTGRTVAIASAYASA